jgi:hypothetical protein
MPALDRNAQGWNQMFSGLGLKKAATGAHLSRLFNKRRKFVQSRKDFAGLLVSIRELSRGL